MPKRRLDSVLADRGLFPSRTRAAASVMAGEVFVGAGKRRAAKPGEMVGEDELIALAERPRFASRGGVKLRNALDSSAIPVAGRTALDVGASTGGFTDCLLQAGAGAVVAIDVGYGLLDYALRSDPRVHVMERTNARELTRELIPDGLVADLAVIDVSFISLTKVLAPVLSCLAGGYDVLALVKPQFEVGRANVGKGGVVRDAGDRRAALVAVGESALALGAAVTGYHSSGLPGPKGNRETFIALADPARGVGTRDARDLDALAREVEP
ncbi:MAG TPA: TlyA family RNA methyltransferase [Solirubrobacteraceae bacterium]|nr:TlyA family RNA methyltransferase [Solirubrobacteraceae bacterium]